MVYRYFKAVVGLEEYNEQRNLHLKVKNKRLASGLSQGELASLTHVSRYSINRFENGKANASKETQNIILRCLNYYVCDKPFYLLVDYLSRFPTTGRIVGYYPKGAWHESGTILSIMTMVLWL